MTPHITPHVRKAIARRLREDDERARQAEVLRRQRAEAEVERLENKCRILDALLVHAIECLEEE